MEQLKQRSERNSTVLQAKPGPTRAIARRSRKRPRQTTLPLGDRTQCSWCLYTQLDRTDDPEMVRCPQCLHTTDWYEAHKKWLKTRALESFKRYRASLKGRKAVVRYQKGPRGQATRKRYYKSPKGKATLHRYYISPKGQAAHKKSRDKKSDSSKRS